MSNLALLNTLMSFPVKKTSKPRKHQLHSRAGFTLIEVLVVVIIIGVLSAIIAPGWLAFTQRQRVNKVNDAVLSSLQQAQREAKRTKLAYSVSFRVANNIPQVAIYSGVDNTTIPSNNWQSLTQDLDIKQGQIYIGTNLSSTSKNTATTSLTTITSSTSTPPTISFDYLGALAGSSNIGTKGLIIGLGSTSTDQTKACIKIMTLLGTFQTGKGTAECSPS